MDLDVHRESIEEVVVAEVYFEEDGEEEETEEPQDRQIPTDETEPLEDQLEQQTFKIVGSHWEDRYQEALCKCYELKVSNGEVNVRAKEEPDNVRDCNAIKFEVLHNEQWHIMGYCGIQKIPKLKRAMHNNAVVSLSIFNMRRKWVPQTREFRFTAGVNIVKKGPWERDDPQNQYNSHIPV